MTVPFILSVPSVFPIDERLRPSFRLNRWRTVSQPAGELQLLCHADDSADRLRTFQMSLVARLRQVW